jgi:hypothetical protein
VIIDCIQDRHKWQAKPVGLWFSVQGVYDWNWWCRAEDFSVENLTYEYKIKLNKNANIVHLSDPEMIYYFTNKYLLKTRDWDAEWDTYQLQWDEVKKDYQGIIISPYQWDCRMDLKSSWYYGWDCASGCIWDLNCIESFECITAEVLINE